MRRDARLWRTAGPIWLQPTELSSHESGAADWFRGDGVSVPVVVGKRGRRTGCSRRPSPDEAAYLAVGDKRVSCDFGRETRNL
jgi:hypothetical protein